MIAIASVFQLLSVYKSELVPSVNQVATHALQAPHSANIRKNLEPKPKLEAGHADSYYDENSAHYMGGAHNVALARLSAQKTGMDVQDVHEMRLQAAKRKTENIQRFSAMFFSKKSLFTLGAFLLSISFGIAFYVHFKTYHAALDKLDKLTALFHNPNARVASGEQGKRILKKLGVGTKKEKQEQKQTHLDDTLQKVAELLQKSKEPQVEAAVNYKPPEIVEETNNVSSYKLHDMPGMTQPLL